MHWLHAVAGVLTGALHIPVVGGFGDPVPIPVHGVAQLALQQVSMPLPSATPLGCCTSQAEMQAATGSPLLDPLVPLVPLVPLEPAEPLVPLEPLEPAELVLLPDEPLVPPLEEVEPSPPELPEQPARSAPTTHAQANETMRFDFMFQALRVAV